MLLGGEQHAMDMLPSITYVLWGHAQRLKYLGYNNKQNRPQGTADPGFRFLPLGLDVPQSQSTGKSGGQGG